MTEAEMDHVRANGRMTAARVSRDLALLTVCIGALAIPFLEQPFHMDDNFYMDMARNAHVKPLYPNDTPYVFEGRFLSDMGSHSHPPLQTYFLALIQQFAGEGPGTEWIYHLSALVFPILAVVAFYFLAARFVERPLWPSLMMACTPLFLVMQHTLMTDVPTLAWWLLAVTCFVWGTDRLNGKLLAASSIFQFAAMFTSYQSVALTPLLAFYQVRNGGRKGGWIALLIPLAALGAWFGLSYVHYGRFLLFDTAGYVASRNARVLEALWAKLVGLLEYQGWLVLFPFFLLYSYGRGFKGRALALAALLGAYVVQFSVPQYRLVDKVVFLIGLVTGVFVVSRMALFLRAALESRSSAGLHPRDAQFLALWYFGVVGYCMVLFTEGSARYILPLVPPLLICFFRQLEHAEASEYRALPRPLLNSAMLASGSLVLSVAFGLLLSHADQEFARVYPRAADEFARVSRGMDSYYGGEWGFRYYFSHAGARQLPVDESLVRGGSWIAKPKLALPYDIPAPLRTMGTTVQSLAYEVNTPLRTLDWQTPAGFYSTAWGMIPFSVSRSSLEIVEILQVNFLVETLPRAHVESTASATPWPGYVKIQGDSQLALLVKPDTRVTYPWPHKGGITLDLRCGVQPGTYAEGKDSPIELAVEHRDAAGRIVTAISATLNPGIDRTARKWHPVRLEIEGPGEKGSVLSLTVSAREKSSSATAAFADGLLRRTQ